MRNGANTKCAINTARRPHNKRLELGQENRNNQEGKQDDETGFCESLHIDIYYRVVSPVLMQKILPKIKAIWRGYLITGKFIVYNEFGHDPYGNMRLFRSVE